MVAFLVSFLYISDYRIKFSEKLHIKLVITETANYLFSLNLFFKVDRTV